MKWGAAVRDRIETRVPPLAKRMGLATDYGKLIETNQVPQITPAGYVLPGLIRGEAVTSMTGMYVQHVTEGVKVLLFVRVAGDALGQKGQDEAEPLVRAVIENLAGWGPADAFGVLVLVSAELVGSARGNLVFEIDFALADQLRIATS